MRRLFACAAALLLAGTMLVRADEWPEYRGKGRAGVWTETGILEKFPESGLKVLWRTPVHRGYTGPAVAGGRVFLMDFISEKEAGVAGRERALCLDEKTGKILWTHEWPAAYGGMMLPNGPRATPTVDGDRVYFLGGMGMLQAFNVASGERLWQTDYVKDYHAEISDYGADAAPIVHGDRLIGLVGGQPDAMVVAWDKRTGKEVWRSLPAKSPPGVSAPTLITYGGRQQLVVYLPASVVSLNPETGKPYWDVPFPAGTMNPALAVQQGQYLLVSTFYIGSMMLKLSDKEPGATMLWKGKSTSEIETDTIHSVIATPVLDGDYVYGLCSYGQLRCLNVKTGERIWESQAVTKEHVRWASGFIVRHSDKYFINNDRGELIIARFTPTGYEEISRTHLLNPTTSSGNRRQLKYVNWSHPAYANRHIYARNDEEIICASLAADGK